MIKMVSGIYGMPIVLADGRTVVRGVGPADGPFTLAPEKEQRLVDRKVAVYVDVVDGDIIDAPEEPAEVDAPIGFDDVPEEEEAVEEEAELIPLEELTAKELRAIGAEYGLTFKANATKAFMIEAITAAQAEEAEDDGEDAPAFDASDAVL